MHLFSRLEKVKTLEDALGIAFKIQHNYGYGHFALQATQDGQLISIGIFDRPNDTVVEAVRFLSQLLHDLPSRESNSLIISITEKNPDNLSDADLSIFTWASNILNSRDNTLLDWIEINDELFRSYSNTLTPNQAWN